MSWIFFNPGMTWQGPLKSFTSWAVVFRSYQWVTSGLSSQYLENWVWIMQPHCSWPRLLLCLLVICLFNLFIHPWRHCGSQSQGRGNGTTKVFFARSWKLLSHHFLCSLTDCHWVSEDGWYCAVPEKMHTHPVEGHWKFLGGGGVLEAKILEAKYEAKLEFPGGSGGTKQKNLLWGEYEYFLELHIAK